MNRENKHRWVAALLAATFLLVESFALCAQTPIQTASTLSLPTVQSAEPKFQATPLQQGDLLMAHQRYQAAIEAYKKAPRDSAEGWNKMGVAYQLMFNTEEAVRCYQKAAKLDPKNASALNNLGSSYVALKQYSMAEKSYRKALKLQPTVALFHKNLGTVLLADHKYKKGWESYQQALAIDPMIFEQSTGYKIQNPSSAQDRGAMNYYMAKGCLRGGNKDRAIEFLRMAINEGFTTPKKLIVDNEFAELRNFPAFQEMLAAQAAP
jgi:Flp pilus assembly protein TadD